MKPAASIAFSASLGAPHVAPLSTSMPSLSFRSLLCLAPKRKARKSKSSDDLSIKSESSTLASTRSSLSPPTYREALGLEENLVVADLNLVYYPSEKKNRISIEEVEQRMQAWDDEVRVEKAQRMVRQDHEMSARLREMGI